MAKKRSVAKKKAARRGSKTMKRIDCPKRRAGTHEKLAALDRLPQTGAEPDEAMAQPKRIRNSGGQQR